MHPFRRHLGDHFSEGARLLWGVLEGSGQSQADLARAIQVDSALLASWLYGDKRPGLRFLERLIDLGIPLGAWTQPPTQPFIVPALREKAS